MGAAAFGAAFGGGALGGASTGVAGRVGGSPPVGCGAARGTGCCIRYLPRSKSSERIRYASVMRCEAASAPAKSHLSGWTSRRALWYFFFSCFTQNASRVTPISSNRSDASSTRRTSSARRTRSSTLSTTSSGWPSLRAFSANFRAPSNSAASSRSPASRSACSAASEFAGVIDDRPRL